MAGEQPISGVTKRVRNIDASLRTLAIESLGAIIGILIAFSVSWWISGALHLRGGFGGYAGTAAIFVVAALVALTITSGLPIHDALAAQRAEISHQQELLQAAADRHQFNADLHTAHRLHTALAESVAAAGVPPFTVSIGLADSTYATTAAAIIAYADAALMTAKREGCDHLIIAAKPDRAVGETLLAAG